MSPARWGGMILSTSPCTFSTSRRAMLPTTSIACTSLVVGGSPLPGGGTRSLRHRDRNTARQNSARRSEHLSSRSPRDAQSGDNVDQRPHRLSLGVDDRLRSSWRRMRSLSWASWRSVCLDSRSCRLSTDWRVAPAAVLVADEMELMVMSVYMDASRLPRMILVCWDR